MANDLTTFFEQSTSLYEIAFFDENEEPVTPNSASYTLLDEDSGSIINSRQDVNITGLSTTAEITLVPADNAIINPEKTDEEVHILQIKFTYNTIKIGRDRVRFSVINMQRVP